MYIKAKSTGTVIDSFGEEWSVQQAAKLYYYIFKRCQATTSHSGYNGFYNLFQSLEKQTAFEYPKKFTLRDGPKDKDFQKILQFIKKVLKYKYKN